MQGLDRPCIAVYGHRMKQSALIRISYACAAAVLIAAGLLSRRVGFIPNCVGDALWAAVVYCGFRFLLPLKSRLLSAGSAIALSYAVEFSQLIKSEWLDGLRSTFIGHMLLGQGFLWSDLAAYTAGAAAALIISCLAGRALSRPDVT